MIPERQRAQGPLALVCDPHFIHLDETFQIIAINAGIHLIYIPPHSSHILQPLDVGCFAHIAREYRKALRDRLSVSMTTVKRADFNKCYEQARPEGLKAQYIAKGWSKSGLFPVNRDKVKAHPHVQNYSYSNA